MIYYCCMPLSLSCYIYKMLRDVGMEVPKIVVNKEASMQQNRG